MSDKFQFLPLLGSGVLLACNLGSAFSPAATTELTIEGTAPAAITPGIPTQISTLPVQTPVPEEAVGTPVPPAGQALLEWEGFGVWGDGDETRCKTLSVDQEHRIQAGFCGQPPVGVQPAGQQFAEMAARLASFEYLSASERVSFNGAGQLDSQAWQRAAAAWAHWTYAEVTSGHACTACRTVLSWDFGPSSENPALCRRLTVLDYGYAVVETMPCAGGELTGFSGGWLEPGEWEIFDVWLYSWSAVIERENYFAGVGTAPITPLEADQIESWAKGVFDRILQDPEAGSGQGG